MAATPLPVLAGGQRPLDTDRLDELIDKLAPERYQYASILAGGNCSADCYFCVGRNLRAPQRAECGPDPLGFINAVAGRVVPYLSLSGLNSDPALLPNLLELIAAGQDAGMTVALHTNGFVDTAAFYERSDKITVSHHTFEPDTFAAIMRRPVSNHARVLKLLERWGPTGKLKLSVTVLPQNAEEIRSGAWFERAAATGVRRVVVRRFTEATDPVEIPAAARRIGTFHGQPVFDLDGLEVTVWDFMVANMALPALYYWPDGRVETSCAWEAMTLGG